MGGDTEAIGVFKSRVAGNLEARKDDVEGIALYGVNFTLVPRGK